MVLRMPASSTLEAASRSLIVMRRRVILESPFAPANGLTVDDHVLYAIAAMGDCLQRGEAPLAFHLLYTQALDDTDHDQRSLGLEASRLWYRSAQAVVMYMDLGKSAGMAQGEALALRIGVPVEKRELGPDWRKTLRVA